MKQNPLLKIQDFGQSIWQDDIRRKMMLTRENSNSSLMKTGYAA